MKSFKHQQNESLRLVQKTQEGAAVLTEIIFAVIFIGILAVSGFYAIGNIMTNFKTNQLTDTISSIQTSIYTMHTMDADYSGLDAQRIIANGHIANSAMNKDRNGLRSPWGEILVSSANSVSGTDDTFKITISDLPNPVCLKIGQMVKSSNDWQSLGVNTGVYDSDEDIDDNITDFLFDNCETGNINELTFTARLQ